MQMSYNGTKLNDTIDEHLGTQGFAFQEDKGCSYASLFGKGSRVDSLMKHQGLTLLQAVNEVAYEEKMWQGRTCVM